MEFLQTESFCVKLFCEPKYEDSYERQQAQYVRASWHSSIGGPGAIEFGLGGCPQWVAEMEGRPDVGERLENGPTQQRSRQVSGRNY